VVELNQATPPPLLIAFKLAIVGDSVLQKDWEALVTVGHCAYAHWEKMNIKITSPL